MVTQKKNKYGHVIQGDISIKKLWIARDVIVSPLNKLTIFLLGLESSPEKKKLGGIQIELRKGLNKIEKYLGIPEK